MEKRYRDFFYYHEMLMAVIDEELDKFYERVKPDTSRTISKDNEIEQLYLMPLEMQRKYLAKRIQEVLDG